LRCKGPQLEKEEEKLKAQKKRIKKKSAGNNLLTLVFDQQLAALKEKRESLAGEIRIGERALEILRDYESPVADSSQFERNQRMFMQSVFRQRFP